VPRTPGGGIPLSTRNIQMLATGRVVIRGLSGAVPSSLIANRSGIPPRGQRLEVLPSSRACTKGLRRSHVLSRQSNAPPTCAASDSTAAMASTSEPRRVAVVGAGISGLTCASLLAKSGCQVMVYETGRGPGGRTSTRQTRDPEKAGWQWSAPPKPPRNPEP